jgi:TorA maturation chaperone TorD
MITTDRPDWHVALAQALTYGYLGRTLMAPDAASWTELQEVHSPALASIEPSEEGLARAMQGLLEAVTQTSLAEAQKARRALFPPVETPDCPAYESAYRGRDVWGQTDLMADVAGFYRAHGLRVGAPIRERPDHIGVELEFMSVVARKEADAIERGDADQVTVCRETSDAFLRDHLGCWGIAFGGRVEQLANASYLRASGELLAAWLEADLATRSIEPVERVGGPTPSAFEEAMPEDDREDGCSPSGECLPIIPLESVLRRVSTGVDR